MQRASALRLHAPMSTCSLNATTRSSVAAVGDALRADADADALAPATCAQAVDLGGMIRGPDAVAMRRRCRQAPAQRWAPSPSADDLDDVLGGGGLFFAPWGIGRRLGFLRGSAVMMSWRGVDRLGQRQATRTARSCARWRMPNSRRRRLRVVDHRRVAQPEEAFIRAACGRAIASITSPPVTMSRRRTRRNRGLEAVVGRDVAHLLSLSRESGR